MNVLTPGFLWAGLAFTAVPIVIHLLFRRRRAPVEWAAMELLARALAAQRRRMWLEQVLLLAVRVGIVLLLGAALSRPLLSPGSTPLAAKSRHLTVVLDDGLASGVRSQPAEAASAAVVRLRNEAAALVRSLEPGDTVSLVLAARPVRTPVERPSSDREAVARLLESIEPTAAATELTAALERADAIAAGAADREAFVAVFSEFRRGSLPPDTPRPVAADSAALPRRLLVEPATRAVDDRAIERLTVAKAIDDETIEIAVRVRRQGPTLGEATARVEIASPALGASTVRSVRFEAGQAEASVGLSVRPMGNLSNDARFEPVVATLEPDALPADDRRHAGLERRASWRIAVVARRSFGADVEIERVPASRWLFRALAPIERSGVEVGELDPAAVDARSLAELDAVVVPRPDLISGPAWVNLGAFVREGGTLLVTPPGVDGSDDWIDGWRTATGDPESLGWTVERSTERFEVPRRLAVEQPETRWLEAVRGELPDLLRPVEVERRSRLDGVVADRVVLQLDDGSPWLLAGSPSGARGVAAFLASSPELTWTSLPVKPLMVPLFQELVRKAIVDSRGTTAATIGDRPELPAGAASLIAPAGREVSVDPTGRPAEPLTEAGLWTVRDRDDRAIGGVVVDVELAAADLGCQPVDVVRTWAGGSDDVVVASGAALPQLLARDDRDTGAARILLAALLALFIVEGFLARRFSRGAGSAERGDPGVTSEVGGRFTAGRGFTT
jgi:hypothetical protein